MIKIYYGPPSLYGRKAIAVLEEKELDYEIIPMDLKAQDHKKPEYLELNPNGEIPTLKDEDFVVYESTAIIEYLNDEYPEPPLLPEDSEGRARVRMIEDYCDLHLYPAIVWCLVKKMLKGDAPEEEDSLPIKEALDRIEKYLGGQEYLAGEFSLADCAFMPVISSLKGLGLEGLMPASEAMQAYVARLQSRPSYPAVDLTQQPA